MQKENKAKYTKKTMLMITLIGVMLVSASFGTFVMYDVYVNDSTFTEAIEHFKKWNLASATNSTPTNGEDGIVNIMIYPHQAVTSVYDSGLDEANAYEHFDASFSDGEELEGETPHDQLVDIVIIYQWDYDHAYNQTTPAWDKDLVRCYMNESQLSIDTLTLEEGDFYNIDGTNDAYMNFYANNGGSGYDIGQMQQIDDTEVKLYWYG